VALENDIAGHRRPLAIRRFSLTKSNVSSGKRSPLVAIAALLFIIVLIGMIWFFQQGAAILPGDVQPVITHHKVPAPPPEPVAPVAENPAPPMEQASVPASTLDTGEDASTAPPTNMEAGSAALQVTGESSIPAPAKGASDESAAPSLSGAPADTPVGDESADAMHEPAVSTADDHSEKGDRVSAVQPSVIPSASAGETALPDQATEAAASARQTSASGYTIQVGAFESQSNAQGVMSELRQAGYDAFTTRSQNGKGSGLYLVRFGHYKDKAAAQASLAEFKRREQRPAIMVTLDGQ
jgi:cell division protein FtsN